MVTVKILPGSRKRGSSVFIGFVLLILFFIFFQEPFIRLYPGSYIKFIDELFILGFLLYLSGRVLITRKVTPLFIISVIALTYMVLISLVGYQHSLQKILIQSVIHWKFFIFIMILDSILLFRPDGESIRKFFKIVAVISVIGLIVNLVLQEQFLQYFSLPPKYRFDILRIEGFQLKPNDLAIHLGILYIYYSIISSNNSTFRISSLTILFLVLILLTGSRAAIIAIPLTLFFYVIYLKQWKILLVMIILALLGLTVFSKMALDMILRTVENISELSDIENSYYIRGIMIYYGAVLMIDNFPIGAGAATYGSVESGGSVVYDQLGLSNMVFFENLTGIYDSNLASLTGEFGAIGLILFGATTYYVYRQSMKKAAHSREQQLYLRIVLVFMVIVSIVNPLFMYSYNALLFALAFKMVGIVDIPHGYSEFRSVYKVPAGQ